MAARLGRRIAGEFHENPPISKTCGFANSEPLSVIGVFRWSRLNRRISVLLILAL